VEELNFEDSFSTKHIYLKWVTPYIQSKENQGGDFNQ